MNVIKVVSFLLFFSLSLKAADGRDAQHIKENFEKLQGYIIKKKEICFLELGNFINVSGADFSGFNHNGYGGRFPRLPFICANDKTFINAERANFTNANLSYLKFDGSKISLKGANFSGANLEGSTIEKVTSCIKESTYTNTHIHIYTNTTSIGQPVTLKRLAKIGVIWEESNPPKVGPGSGAITISERKYK